MSSCDSVGADTVAISLTLRSMSAALSAATVVFSASHCAFSSSAADTNAVVTDAVSAFISSSLSDSSPKREPSSAAIDALCAASIAAPTAAMPAASARYGAAAPTGALSTAHSALAALAAPSMPPPFLLPHRPVSAADSRSSPPTALLPTPNAVASAPRLPSSDHVPSSRPLIQFAHSVSTPDQYCMVGASFSPIVISTSSPADWSERIEPPRPPSIVWAICSVTPWLAFICCDMVSQLSPALLISPSAWEPYSSPNILLIRATCCWLPMP